MKKLILFLLLPLWAISQTSTTQEQEFDYGIKNNSTQTITTPPYLTTTGMDGTQGKIPSALIAKTSDVADSLATKENVANKSDSYTASSSITYASTAALVGGLSTKIPLSEKGATNGVATLGSDGKVSNSQIPALTTANITDSAGKRYQTDNQKLFNDATSSIQTQLNSKENSFTKNTAFNKNFGITAGTVAEGNDSRFTNSRNPLPNSANYIQNQNASAQAANMWISGNIKAGAATFASTVTATGGDFSGSTNFGTGMSTTTINGKELHFYNVGASPAILKVADDATSINSIVLYKSGAVANVVVPNGVVTASNGTLIGGTLSSGYIPKATGANSLGNSVMSQDGSGGIVIDGAVRAGYLYMKAAGANKWVFGGNSGEETNNFNLYNFNTLSVNFSVKEATGNASFSNNLSVGGSLSATSYTGSATLTGTPTAPTAAPGTRGNQIATLDYVHSNAGGGSGDMLLGTNQTVTSKKTFSNSGASTIGLDLNNSGTSSTYVLKVNNTASGWGQSIINSSNGVGINCLNSGTNVGIYTDNTKSGFGIYSMNQAGGVGIISTNNSTGTGIYISNLSSGKGLSINNSATSTGIPFSISKDSIDKLNISDGGIVDATQYKLKALNTAPISATATGTLGEIRYDANYMYVCVATNTWKRSALLTW